MFFIGQTHIINTLKIILPHLFNLKLKGTPEGHAFLLRGPSGFGKTELALKICNYLSGTDFLMSLGNDPKISGKCWVHFIDEVHLIENPEFLYPLIDSGQFVFVFATNHDAILPEAFTNRCTNLIFTEYTDDELIRIFRRHCNMDFPEDVIRHIIYLSGRNPRIMIKTYANNLYLYYLYRKNEKRNATTQDIINTVNNLNSIDENLPPGPKRYIDILSILGGRASVSLIASMLHLDVETVKREIEPFLLQNNMIRISSKGRVLCLER